MFTFIRIAPNISLVKKGVFQYIYLWMTLVDKRRGSIACLCLMYKFPLYNVLDFLSGGGLFAFERLTFFKEYKWHLKMKINTLIEKVKDIDKNALNYCMNMQYLKRPFCNMGNRRYIISYYWKKYYLA